MRFGFSSHFAIGGNSILFKDFRVCYSVYLTNHAVDEASLITVQTTSREYSTSNNCEYSINCCCLPSNS